MAGFGEVSQRSVYVPQGCDCNRSQPCLCRRCPLLLRVLRGEFVKPLRAELFRHHVLIDVLEHHIQILIPLLQRHHIQLGLFYTGLAFDVRFFYLTFDKGRFKLLDIDQDVLHVD